MISLIIPVHNQLEYTKQCVDSIIKHTQDIPYELIFVDNGSTDDSPRYLKSLNAYVLSNQTNQGVAKAWNQGLNHSKGNLIGILNNDIVVPPNWLQNIVKGFTLQPDAGCICPIYESHNKKPDYETRSANLSKMPVALSRGFIGFCFFATRQTYDIVGNFDEQFDMCWYEDSDFLMRLHKHNLISYHINNVLIHHYESRTLVNLQDRMKYIYENKDKYNKKWNT